MRVLEKCGLKKEGARKDSILRFGEVCDDLLYGMTREDWEGWNRISYKDYTP